MARSLFYQHGIRSVLRLGRPRRVSCSLLVGLLSLVSVELASARQVTHAEDENHPPDCHLAVPSHASLWPPNHRLGNLTVLAVTDPDGDPVTVSVVGVLQDEPVHGRGDGHTTPDAFLRANGSVDLRAERSGPGDGRVYHVIFVADDGQGGMCTGMVQVCVPHDHGKNGRHCIDEGLLYNSLQGGTCEKGYTPHP